MIGYGFGVSLRALYDDDAEKLRTWRNDDRIRQHCRQCGLLSERDQRRWMESQNDDKTIRMFGVVDSHDILLGVCGLTSIDLINRRAEFSLYIAPFDHKKGYGRSALRTLCKFGFDELGLNLIWGESFETNGGMAMFRQIGFVKEGVRRKFYFKGGKFIDAHLFSLLKNEFKE